MENPLEMGKTGHQTLDSVDADLPAARPRQHDVRMTEGSGGGRRADPSGRLDETAKRIIELLQEDGRASYATIAKTVGLSEAAARARVQKLLDTEVMQVVAVTDPTQVGFTRQAMIGVRTEGDPMAVGDRLAELAEVDYVVTTAGSFDVLVEVVCEDDPHLLDVIRSVREVEGVVSSETFVYLKLNKQHYNWGTR